MKTGEEQERRAGEEERRAGAGEEGAGGAGDGQEKETHQHQHQENIRKSGFCYISSYSTIYANIVSIVLIVSKGNPLRDQEKPLGYIALYNTI